MLSLQKEIVDPQNFFFQIFFYPFSVCSKSALWEVLI